MNQQATGGQPRAAGARAAKYIYAVAAARPGQQFDFTGIDERRVEVIARNAIASVVSDFSGERIRPERRHLAAHRAVLSHLVESEEAVLPMRFGTIASGTAEIERLLARNREAFAGELRRVFGKIEMGLRVVWDVPNIFDYFVRNYPELRMARDRVFLRGDRPSQDERIELGRTFESILDEERQRHTRTVVEVLSDSCAEIIRGTQRQEREVMNLACLVDKRRRADFEQGVLEVAQRFDNNFAFDYSGPWAPHTFAEISLKS